jgi:hypothetical protein
MLILFCCNNIKSRIVIHNFWRIWVQQSQFRPLLQPIQNKKSHQTSYLSKNNGPTSETHLTIPKVKVSILIRNRCHTWLHYYNY